MDITCIADLHGHYPTLEGGDLLIIAGDLTARDTQDEHMRFLSWTAQQAYRKKIWIAGNHDNYLIGTTFIPIEKIGMEYLCDSGTEFEGLKIWGFPWTHRFDGINPECCAFTFDEKDHNSMIQKLDLIPDDTDILVSHGPPFGILDEMKRGDHAGCKILMCYSHIINPKLHVFGHIHEGYGELTPGLPHYINCSHVNERYEPVNKPVRVVL